MVTKGLNLSSLICRKILKSNFLTMSRRMSTSEDEVLFETIRNMGVITLNRPKALNALNLPMVRKIYEKMQEWETKIGFVLIKGAGEKSFCAGGDVRAIVESGMKGGKLGFEFFREEYMLNGLIGSYKIPYVALIDGIVMGGGVGLSVHGDYRVATEKTLFAMPETLIGLFPDVGATYVLPRLQGKLGVYLALTGQRLKGYDVFLAGIATHYCDSNRMPELEEALSKCNNDRDIKDTLKKFGNSLDTPFSLAPVLSKINKCFSAPSIETILKALEEDGSDWARNTISTLSKMSPTSLKVSLKAVNEGEKLNLLECLQVEHRISCACLSNKDFYEGVRALLIDKDQNPNWQPATLAGVTDDYVNSFFNKLPGNNELRFKL
ncbi:hypothetical protein PPYR_04125 [Photinus pyralis]|uniref:3-hydroxyisobutyryl-CoA hydrolase, mitochondrial n=1 Tax=Photinus pyralis TaxID=7054 RepID=A0A1Y1KBE0_PHOPY|nr:3-hydroxyisobutyryl-CoA hydrolase, mitochondrial [Photinus pyralis]KAB0801939.1 hypothetical protein PPYR_04125 [Photinus pyralis]